MKPLQLAAFEGLQGMTAPVLNREYACRGAGDKYRLSMQGKRMGTIFGNIGQRRDGNFHGFSILDQRCVLSVENS